MLWTIIMNTDLGPSIAGAGG